MEKMFFKLKTVGIKPEALDIENKLDQIKGISIQCGSFATGNVIIAFNPALVEEDKIIEIILRHGVFIDYYCRVDAHAAGAAPSEG